MNFSRASQSNHRRIIVRDMIRGYNASTGGMHMLGAIGTVAIQYLEDQQTSIAHDPVERGHSFSLSNALMACTVSSAVKEEVSINIASSACFRGDTSRVESY